jgi:uncharacterized membrane protein
LAWSLDRVSGSLQRQAEILNATAAPPEALPAPEHIEFADLLAALRDGFDDFKALRTDVIFLCIVYPLAGLVLGNLALGGHVFQLAFPLAAGFALLGPVFAAGLYEMSRQRERSETVNWMTAFDVLHSPATPSIGALGVLLVGLFAAWLVAAELIYNITLGPGQPASLAAFADALFNTSAGTALMVLGVAVGFCFAAIVLAISVVSFPLMLDRHVGVRSAVAMSVRVARENPATMAAWGLIVAAGLLLGSAPFLIGLAIALPVLGHATWHLYRRILPR